MTRTFFTALASVSLLALAPTGSALAQDSDREQESLANPDSAFKGDGRRASYHADIERTERGHLIGNPDADTSLIEFVSYTCGHCASFTREGEGALDMILLAPGKMNLEIRPVIRNVLDLTVSMLVQCGPVDGFKNRHRMYMLSQDDWLEQARSAPASQQALWARGDASARLSAARALDLDDMLAKRGTSIADINTCLADEDAALALIGAGNADRDEFAVPGTPSFALDGELLTSVHSWDALQPVLLERFSTRPSTSHKLGVQDPES
ncbi:thioredoxin domain-containing protein [Erythrobacter sp.]|uniref:thioredoxin domain-containing protein n=1 Tax=Erythrobacter sp. TaxID=1042 RepID=UPI003C706E4D